MGSLAFIRRVLLGLGATVLGLAVAVLAARADELSGAAAGGDGIVIHDAAQTLTRYCVTDTTGVTWLTLPGGGRWELVTSTADPVIANPGDGSFHPFEAAEVRAAIDGVRYPLAGIGVEVFILPYPRRAGLTSAAAPGMVLLSPGVTPIARETQHATVTHELGHVVHLARMPDADATTWSRWRTLRGVTDPTLYSAHAPHADRPHEIFAEDFRVLFGDPLAVSNGAIENAALAPPVDVPGLATFVRSLTGDAAGLGAWPNPSRGAVTFTRAGATAARVEIFDVTGRRVATLAPEGSPTAWTWPWDGRGDDGRALPPGRYAARERGATVSTLVTRLR
ncbi:MAG: FlgD immunoglobulin-like domain containing protein [Candidatus Eisenbacteria bacterium]